ncbi:murein transglycosylase A [Lichenihabitans psoromatis]|uniref:murein transglycosylase A n=1 Tax=Lichenihabitans psoromatis TaxID=2528642 RepID=UPI001035D494|nr:MltA domain-containing protein [Lichenihabitans psoromatis]
MAPIGGDIPFPGAVRLRFDELDGFSADDHRAAFACLLRSATAALDASPALRPALAVPDDLRAILQAAVALDRHPSDDTCRRFFETHFDPFRVASATGKDAFFTGYYEPLLEASLEQSPAFTAPLLARPDDLKTFAADEPRPAALAGYSAAQVGRDGALSRYPDRAAIEAGIASGTYRPVVWLRDWVEVFLVQVQGSARVSLPDGRVLRITYAGRNGHPYTSIGKIIVEETGLSPDALVLDGLKAWLRQHGQAVGQVGRSVMQRNASYIFFETVLDASGDGPIGGAGFALTPLRSIAIDRTLWCYGLPFWVDATLPWMPSGPAARFARLMIAQDTGSAITGPARADLFFGTGEEAGRLAGGIRHHGTFVVLWPKGRGGAPG